MTDNQLLALLMAMPFFVLAFTFGLGSFWLYLTDKAREDAERYRARKATIIAGRPPKRM